MQNGTDEQVRTLEAANPDYQVWAVHHAVDRRITWCARRWDWKPGDTVINADTPEHLSEQIREAEQRD
jgi:hypothetical protein